MVAMFYGKNKNRFAKAKLRVNSVESMVYVRELTGNYWVFNYVSFSRNKH